MNSSFKLVKDQVLVYGIDQNKKSTQTLRMIRGNVKKVLYQENVIEELEKTSNQRTKELDQLQEDYHQKEKNRQKILRNLVLQSMGMAAFLSLSSGKRENTKKTLTDILRNASLLAGASIVGPIHMSDEIVQYLDYQKKKASLQRRLWITDNYLLFSKAKLSKYEKETLTFQPSQGEIDPYYNIPQIVSQNIRFYEIHQKELEEARMRCTILPYVSIYFPRSAYERTQLFSYLVDSELKEREKIKIKR